VKRKVATERRTVPVGETKFGRKRRKLPAAMMSYIKPRRKRRLLSGNVSLPSAADIKPETEDFSVKSDEAPVAVKPAGVEVTGRLTSASIMSRYRRLDRQRSQTRRISGRTSVAENGTRPSTRSQTAAIMHRQLVVARMKSHEEIEPTLRQQHGGVTLSKSYTTASKHVSSDLSHKSQTSEQHVPSEKRLSSESLARRSAPEVKKEVSDGKGSERSMRRFIRRRNIETSDVNRGLLNMVIDLEYCI